MYPIGNGVLAALLGAAGSAGTEEGVLPAKSGTIRTLRLTTDSWGAPTMTMRKLTNWSMTGKPSPRMDSLSSLDMKPSMDSSLANGLQAKGVQMSG